MKFEAMVVEPGDWGPSLPLTNGGHCRPIIWPGMGAVERSLHEFRLPKDAGTIDMSHPGEAVYYVVNGEIDVTDIELSETRRLGVGAMFHVEPDTRYAFAARDGDALVLGGPSPADPALYVALESVD